jgi:hypothetical protein
MHAQYDAVIGELAEDDQMPSPKEDQLGTE